MKINPKKINSIIKKIEAILERMYAAEQQSKPFVEKVHPDYQMSAVNLIHYHVFRRSDLRTTQRRLGNLGLTRFSNAQGHITDSLLRTLFILYRLIDDPPMEYKRANVSIKRGKRILKKNTTELLGKPSETRRVRIMVTMPTEASYNYELVLNMVRNGMNCARINCAHDAPEVWENIINNVKNASREVGHKVKIAMDLAGPKIRTGPVKPGPKVRKFKPKRDEEGKVLSAAEILLIPEIARKAENNTLILDAAWLNQLKIGDTLGLLDIRHKKRELHIVKIQDNRVYAHCNKTSYISPGTIISCKNRDIESVEVGELPAIEMAVFLKSGDTLQITKEVVPGRSALIDTIGKVRKKAHIACQLPEVFEKIQVGDKVLFDDGKIEGSIENITDTHFDVNIVRAAEKGAKLKAEKGMNFPNTNLGISGLTPKDKIDLKFIAKHADIVNFSFVNSAKDVRELLGELEKWDAINRLGIILKIETAYAFDNMKEILLEAMRVKPIGVMIARGDLAVEIGWDTIGRVQREILELCGAAHVPVVWATQVLENLAKTGLPSRSEITDVVSALRAECVMLNKGPFMNDVLKLLSTILSDMENFQEKTETMLPSMKKL